jgi:hypothetical protein
MTEDSDFKRIVRDRAAKTGESYQTARRVLTKGRGGFSAVAMMTFYTPSGPVLGCVIDRGKVQRGMPVTVIAPGQPEHHGVVVSLRHMWRDLESVAYGEWDEFGLLLEPAYGGPLPAKVTGG